MTSGKCSWYVFVRSARQGTERLEYDQGSRGSRQGGLVVGSRTSRSTYKPLDYSDEMKTMKPESSSSRTQTWVPQHHIFQAIASTMASNIERQSAVSPRPVRPRGGKHMQVEVGPPSFEWRVTSRSWRDATPLQTSWMRTCQRQGEENVRVRACFRIDRNPRCQSFLDSSYRAACLVLMEGRALVHFAEALVGRNGHSSRHLPL